MQTHPVSPPRSVGTHSRPPATSATPSQPRGNPDSVQLRWLNAAMGKPVGLEMMDGDRVEGKLLGFDRYTLLVEPPGSARLAGLEARGDNHAAPVAGGKAMKALTILCGKMCLERWPAGGNEDRS